MVSMANLGTAVSRLVAENAIESDQTNRLIHRAGAVGSQAEIDQKNKAKELANAQHEAAAYVEMASSTVNVARSGAKVGEAAAEYAQYTATEPELTSGTEHARSTDEATKAQGMGELLNTRLGEDGPKVGDRFSKEQLTQLMRNDLGARPNETRAQWNERVGKDLKASGLSEGQVNQVWDKAKDGNFSNSDAVNFLWANRKTPGEQKATVQRDKIIDAIQGQSVAFLNRNFSEGAKKAQAQGKRSGEEAGMLSEISEKAMDATVEHNKKLGDLEIQGLRQRRGGTGSTQK